MDKAPKTPDGYRTLRKGERISATDMFYPCDEESMGLEEMGRGHGYGVGDQYDPETFVSIFRKEPKKPTTPKTKETKTMNTKKPGTTHGKPTAKGMKEALKPKARPVKARPVKAKTAPKPKYPAPRVPASVYVPDYSNVTAKTIKTDLVKRITELHDIIAKDRIDLATTGTKLDRALVDLKEAKAKIKELSKGTEAAK